MSKVGVKGRGAVLVVPVAFLAVLTLGGCLISETDELHVVLASDLKSGTLTLTQANLQSDDTTATGRHGDFASAIASWSGDQSLIDGVEQGYYIKERRMWVEEGKLTWEQVALFAPPPNDFLELGPGGRYRARLQKSEEVVLTNGSRTAVRDTVFVVWPRGTREFRLKIRHRDFSSVSFSR